jgi:hypothetical protein
VGWRAVSQVWTEICHTMYDDEQIVWDAAAAHHIRTRSSRYPGALNIEPEWTSEVIVDPDRLVDEPDPNSAHANSVRIIGYSPSARTILTVVALRGSDRLLHGASAWRSNGAARRRYRGGSTHG